MTYSTADIELAEEMAKYYADPLGFVLMAYPWGEKGTPLENEEGPDANQRQFLIDLGAEVKARGFRGGDPVMPILMCISSGHGTGKSVLGAWIANWIMSTRPHSIGTVTANTLQAIGKPHLGSDPVLDQAMHHGTLVRHPEDGHLFEAEPRRLESGHADLPRGKRSVLRRPTRQELHLLVHV